MPRTLLSHWRKIATNSQQRLIVLTIILICLLIASIGAIVGHQLTGILHLADHSQQQAEMDKLLPSGQLVVAINPNHQPLRYQENDRFKGFEVDLAKAIGLELSRPVKFKYLEPSQILDNPQANPAATPLSEQSIDLIISGVTINRSRQQNFSLSQPYLAVPQVAITIKGAKKISQLSQLKGKSFGLIEQTTIAELAHSSSLKPDYPTTSADILLQQLLEKKIDYALIDLPTAHQWLSEHQQLIQASPALTEETYAIAADKSATQLIKKVNQALNTLEQKGVIASLEYKWLTPNP